MKLTKEILREIIKEEFDKTKDDKILNFFSEVQKLMKKYNVTVKPMGKSMYFRLGKSNIAISELSNKNPKIIHIKS